MPDSISPYKNPHLTISQRVDDLLGRMTLVEKVGQLQQMFIVPDNREQAVELVRKGGLGSRILSTTNLAGNANEKAAEIHEVNQLQRVAVEESRLGIPLIHGRDIIHGHRTVFPIPLAMAASWNPALIEQAYTIAAREAASAGVHWAFAPMLDIARDPRWGRIIEGFGEDPYLASRMAAAAVHGFQGEDNSTPDRILACAKHYLGYGAAAGGRDYDTAEISDNTLRNIYLPPFKAAVEAGLGSVMSAFHDLNGESTSGSHYLLTQLLKGECGFSGMIVSDWGSVLDLVNHRLAEDARGAAKLAFQAGVDMEMVTTCYAEHLVELVENGEISQERLDDACRRILTAKFQWGLFDHPYTDPELAPKVQFCAEHTALARQLASQCVVLLQNKGSILPLSKDSRRIAVIGPLAHQRMALLGSWTLDGLIDETQTVYEAICEAVPQAKIPRVSDSLTDEMLLAATRADTIILVVGESNARSGENNNVASIDLPAGQNEIIEAVAGLGKPFVLVVCAGRPVNLSRSSRLADAILYAWHPGSKGAAAIADVLFGLVNPSGKLAVTFPRSDGQIPIYYNAKSTGKDFDLVGRRVPPDERPIARYQDIPGSPLYPFGFGLSYTTFAYQDIRVDKPAIKPDETVTVSARVTNTGLIPGEEIIQCYIQDCVASLTRPVKELKGFTRLSLQPGETRLASFILGYNELSFYGSDGKLCLEPGKFRVWIGPSSAEGLESSFHVV